MLHQGTDGDCCKNNLRANATPYAMLVGAAVVDQALPSVLPRH